MTTDGAQVAAAFAKIAASGQDFVAFFDLDTGKAFWSHDNVSALAIELAADGRLVAALENLDLAIFPPGTNRPTAVMKGHDNRVRTAAFSPSERTSDRNVRNENPSCAHH